MSASIVICTDGRKDSLKTTLESLRCLNNFDFEVCVVCGPTEDGTWELVSSWPNPLKIAFNAERNLSISRNLGIRMAAGDIVAFLDDDAIPEPEWMDQILEAYADPQVGAAGGFVYDHTGMNFQWRFGTADRLGDTNYDWKEPAPEFNFPFSFNFPHLLGANSTFRRDALIGVLGFDEEFDYFLDETDVICRLVDYGWLIRQLSGAYVHHKYKPSHIRNEHKALRSWYPTLKNKLYYSLLHAREFLSIYEICQKWMEFAHQKRQDCESAVSKGFLTSADKDRFEMEVAQAFEEGLRRGLSGKRRLMDPGESVVSAPPFKRFRASRRGDRRAYALLTREYGPGPVGGGALHVGELAKGLAELDHQVHVITTVPDFARVDFEDGVWVHRLVVEGGPETPPMTESGPIPPAIWASSACRERYVTELSKKRTFDAAYALIWDCEGAALLRGGRWPVVSGLQTTLALWLDSHPRKRADIRYMSEFARPMLALEREMLAKSHAVHGISRAIVEDVEAAYAIELGDRARVIPLGIADLSKAPRAPIDSRHDGVELRLLFAGRLEARKGIDVLLAVAPRLLQEFPGLQIDIVGNDAIGADDGSNYRANFEARNADADFMSRIVFYGEVSNDVLRAMYAECDIFFSPSRYESFGLVFLEAMTFGKPVVGCNVGGMKEVIEDGETGFLATPGDVESLRDALRRLIEDEPLRERMGRAGRLRYEAHFQRERMAKNVSLLLEEANRRWRIGSGVLETAAE